MPRQAPWRRGSATKALLVAAAVLLALVAAAPPAAACHPSLCVGVPLPLHAGSVAVSFDMDCSHLPPYSYCVIYALGPTDPPNMVCGTLP